MFAFVVKTVYRLSHFQYIVIAEKNALVNTPQERPTILELNAGLSADICIKIFIGAKLVMTITII